MPNGNTGIGNEEPNATLDVSGGIKTDDLNVTTLNITGKSLDGTIWDCGVDNSGVWSCS